MLSAYSRRSSKKRTKSAKLRCMMDDLPNEVLGEIGKLALLNGDIKHLSHTNRRIHAILVPFLYRKIHADGFIGLFHIIDISLSPFAKYVERITIRYPDIDADYQPLAVELGLLFSSLLATSVPHDLPNEWSQITINVCQTLAECNGRQYSGWNNEAFLLTTKENLITCLMALIDFISHNFLARFVALKSVALKGCPDQSNHDSRWVNAATSKICNQFLGASLISDLFFDGIMPPRHKTPPQYEQLISLSFVYSADQFPGVVDTFIRLINHVRTTVQRLCFIYPASWECSFQIFDSSDIWQNLQSFVLIDNRKQRHDNMYHIFCDQRYSQELVVIKCPLLRRLELNTIYPLPNLSVGTKISHLTITLEPWCLDYILSWLDVYNTVQSINFNLVGWPQPAFIVKIFKIITHILSLEIRVSDSDGKFETSALAEAFLISGLNSLHPHLQHLSIIDADTDTVQNWFSNAAALKRIFPSLRTFGHSRVDELFDEARYSEDVIYPTHSNVPNAVQATGWTTSSTMNQQVTDEDDDSNSSDGSFDERDP